MPVNQILPFATGTGANVMLPADYEALPALPTGFGSGIASSQQLNTVWRQSSVVAAMIAKFIVDQTGGDVLDDGDVTGLEAKLVAALNALSLSNSHATQLGIGADLSTTNMLDGVDLNTVFDCGDKYFKNTCTNAPFPFGLMKVWREGAGIVYQLVQGAGDTGLAWRYYSVTTTGWLPWKYAAVTDSPVFTGTPTAPTPTTGDNTTKLATTEFVKTAIDAIPSAVPPQGGSQSTGGVLDSTPLVLSQTLSALPSNGFIYATGALNGGPGSYNFHALLGISGTGVSDGSIYSDCVVSQTQVLCLAVAAGSMPTISLAGTSDIPQGATLRLAFFYIPA